MKAILIDLDDTLFSELSYVHSGYKEVAEAIADYNGLDSEDVLNQMKYQLSKYGRIGVFDNVKKYFETDSLDTSSLVNLYRAHSPNIELYWKAEEGLRMLRRKFKLAIVTDGHPTVQRKKIKALDLNNLVDEVIYCMDYDAPKPSLIPYFEAIDKLGVEIEDVIIVGDDPYYDMKAAALLGVTSYRLLQGKHIFIKSLKDASPDADFGSFFTVAHFLSGENT
ncbi:hypothetical protein LCGC14_0772740 [marine sediment metagenome]|uniref:FCP1 homology domain-containing protein n=1 Tax=marine sediment metagenome TaxID=412755 RepID=A0A0F9T4P3_9ZZZZ